MLCARFALARFAHGEPVPAITLLEMAISVAAVLQDRTEEAIAFAEIGFFAMRCGHDARAVTRLRAAIDLLPDGEAPYLRGTLDRALATLHDRQRRRPGTC